MSEAAKNVRNVMQRRTPSGYIGEVKAFPEDKINELLWEVMYSIKMNIYKHILSNKNELYRHR
jgi:hypothetical protein